MLPGLFRSTEPEWNDQNLRELTQAIESPLFFSHVRAAAGPPIQQTNCHPFRFGNWLFMHNGALAAFGPSPMAQPFGPSGIRRSGRRAPCSTLPTSPRCKRSIRISSGFGCSVNVPTSWSPSH
jgi:glutamine amidotransferase class II-like protein